MKKSESYQVKTLAEADPEGYGALLTKRSEIQGAAGEARRLRKAVEQELAADTSADVRAGVAVLLGDSVSEKEPKRQRLADAKRLESDADAALQIIEQRIRDARPAAVRKAIQLVKPEFDRRMAELCTALKRVQQAHLEFDSLCRDLESEEVSPDHLGPKPHFLGDARDGRIAYYFKEAGYA